MRRITFSLIVAWFISGCATSDRQPSSSGSQAGQTSDNNTRVVSLRSDTVLDLSMETAFSNALAAARDAFPDYRVQGNKDETVVAIWQDEGEHFLTIEPVNVISTNPTAHGIQYEMRERSSGQIRSWVSSYLSQPFFSAYSSRFTNMVAVQVGKQQVKREAITLPEGVRIGLEMRNSGDQETGVDVLQTTFEQALTLAYETAQAAFPFAKVDTSPDRSSVLVLQEDGSRQYLFGIEPRIMKSPDRAEDYGILYRYSGRVVSPGYSGSSSTWQEQRRFEEEFWNRNAERIPAKWLPQYRVSYDQGVPDRIASSIPTTYEGFRRYLDGRKGLLPFEGIWTEADGMYTLGIVHVAGDPRYSYHAFILESRLSSWRAGEVKAKFSDLKVDKISVGEYRVGSKALFGLSWRVKRDLLEGVSSILGQNIVFIRTYPSGPGGDFITGVGTAWAITEDGVFVTAAHVVDGATKIRIGFKEKDPVEATVLVLDEKLDLAVVKTQGDPTRYKPIPVMEDLVSDGTEITALGYPLAFQLGDDVKVTEGVVSSQSGLHRDVTMYQISASVQAGNSGGPIVDLHGNAVGVVVSGLSGSDTELVNYAVKSPYLGPLLKISGVEGREPGKKTLSPRDIANIYKGSVLPIWTEN